MQLETESTIPHQDTDMQAVNVVQAPRPYGLLFVLSAPSGAGKDSVIQALKDQRMDFHVVSSVTTRAPRAGESEGNPYHFVNEETFKRMINNGEFLEHAQVHGHWYGQPRRDIRDHLLAGRDVLLKIDVQGGATVRQKVPDAIFIFLVPGSVEELMQRLIHRQTETESERKLRLYNAQNELAQRVHYDYIVENRQGHLAEAVDYVRAIILAERCRTNPHYVHMHL